MTAAPDGQPSGPAHAAPSGTAGTPGRGSRWLKALPRHVGRARTSTVVLAVLFLAIGTLYLNVHPTATGTTTPAVVQPRPASHPTTSRTRSTATPTTSSAVPTSSSSAPTSSTPSSQPTTSAPAATPSSPAPATSSTPTLPTVGSATAAPTS
jgi:cytoskeletal protein RodZ